MLSWNGAQTAQPPFCRSPPPSRPAFVHLAKAMPILGSELTKLQASFSSACAALVFLLHQPPENTAVAMFHPLYFYWRRSILFYTAAAAAVLFSPSRGQACAFPQWSKTCRKRLIASRQHWPRRQRGREKKGGRKKWREKEDYHLKPEGPLRGATPSAWLWVLLSPSWRSTMAAMFWITRSHHGPFRTFFQEFRFCIKL